MIHPCCLILEFKSEKHDEGEQYIAPCWNEVYIEWVGSILHIVLRWNETLKRGGESNQRGNAGVKKVKLQRADPLRVMS